MSTGKTSAIPSFVLLLFWLCCIVNGTVAQSDQGDYFTSLKRHKTMEEQSVYQALDWYSIGPSFMGSRIESIDCPIDQPGVIYAGFGSGGLWKTTNFGQSWKNVFANHGYSIGDVAVSLSNPEVVWLGTGENLRASRGFSFPGTGIYKSVDGGGHWQNMGLHDSHHISRVVIDPRNPDRVFVAVLGHFWTPNEQRGVFMTEDGGQHWKSILYFSDSVGASDVVWDSRYEILYAASWQIPGGPGSAIYKSMDLGKSWEKIDQGFQSGRGIGRIGLAVAPSQPERLYAVVDNRNKNLLSKEQEQRGLEVYRSDNQGAHWSKTHREILGNYSGFGWAFGDVIVSPVNSEEIYVLGVYALHSLDGGKSFSRMGGTITHMEPNPGTFLHLDQHDLFVNPLNPDQLILGNDGGVFSSFDHGASWFHMNTIPTGEFYSISITDEDPLSIYGGTQDNSSIMGKLPVNNLSSKGYDWKYVWLDPWSGGDGFVTLEDPSDPEFVYWESQNGYLNRKNMTTGISKLIKPIKESDERPLRNSWKTPFFVSKHDHKSVYYAANKVYKTINRGEDWIRLSHDLTFSADKSKNSRAITALAESPINRGYIVAATEKGIVWITRNDGTQWFEISEGIPLKKVVDIIPSCHQASRIYLVAKGMDDDDMNPYIYVTDNLGENWRLITNNLPEIPINCLLEDPKLENTILAGSDLGVFISHNKGQSWIAISKNLPLFSIQQLSWGGDDRFIFAASHGGGLFRSYYEPIRNYNRKGNPDEYTILGSLPGKTPREKDYQGDWDLESLEPMLIAWYAPVKDTVILEIQDSTGSSIWSNKVQSSLGLNQYVWNLEISRKVDKSIYPIPEIEFLKPGKYNFFLKNGENQLHDQIMILNHR